MRLAYPCSSYEADGLGQLHDLSSGPLGVIVVAAAGVGALIAGARVFSRDRQRAARAVTLLLIVSLALGTAAAWLGMRLVETTAECRGPGPTGWGGRQLATRITRSGLPAYVVSAAIEGDSTPSRRTSPLAFAADLLFWTGIAAALTAAVSVRARPRSRSPNAPAR